MRTSSKKPVKEIEESTTTWKILDDVLKRMEKLSPGKVPALPEMERMLKELRKGKRKGGTVSRKEVGGQVRRQKPKAKKAPKVPVGAGMDFPASKRNIFYDLEWDNKAGTWYSIPKKIDKRTGKWKRIGSGKKPAGPGVKGEYRIIRPSGYDWVDHKRGKNKGAYSGPKIKRGGTVKRKAGGKIMQGYKAGGKV